MASFSCGVLTKTCSFVIGQFRSKLITGSVYKANLKESQGNS